MRRRLLLAAPACLVLPACVTPYTTPLFSRPDTSLDDLDQRAVVVFSISHGIAPKASMATAVMFDGRRAGEPERPLVVVNDEGAHDAHGRSMRTLAITLAPGRHTLGGWSVTGSGSVALYPYDPPRRLDFEVAAGEAIYLGNLHATILFEMIGPLVPATRVLVASMDVRDRADEDIADAEAQAPVLKGRIRKAVLPLGPWGTSLRDTRPLRLTPAGPST